MLYLLFNYIIVQILLFYNYYLIIIYEFIQGFKLPATYESISFLLTISESE